jgi:hypothetical protein
VIGRNVTSKTLQSQLREKTDLQFDRSLLFSVFAEKALPLWVAHPTVLAGAQAKRLCCRTRAIPAPVAAAPKR